MKCHLAIMLFKLIKNELQRRFLKMHISLFHFYIPEMVD